MFHCIYLLINPIYFLTQQLDNMFVMRIIMLYSCFICSQAKPIYNISAYMSRSYIINWNKAKVRTHLCIILFKHSESTAATVTPHLWAPCSWHPVPCFSEQWQPNTPPCRYPSAAAPLGWAAPSPYALLHECMLQTVHTQNTHTKGIKPSKGCRCHTGERMVLRCAF